MQGYVQTGLNKQVAFLTQKVTHYYKSGVHFGDRFSLSDISTRKGEIWKSNLPSCTDLSEEKLSYEKQHDTLPQGGKEETVLAIVKRQ